MPRKRDGQSADLSLRIHRAFGRRLAEARTRCGLLQQELGRRLGLSRTSVSNLECGSRAVFLDQVYQAAQILGVDVRDLLPPMAEMFPPVAVHAATDDQVSEERALSVLRRVEQRLKTTVPDKREGRRQS